LAVYSIVLPRHESAAFPDRCVVCNAGQPGASARLIARDNLNGHRLWLGWFSVRVPCCPACGVRLQLWRAWDFCRTLLLGAACFAFGMIYLLPRLEGWAAGLIVLGLCGAGFLAVFIWNRFSPPAFQMDVHETQVEYEFRDAALAQEFAELNGARPADEPPEG
jgi:hypothetical protein